MESTMDCASCWLYVWLVDQAEAASEEHLLLLRNASAAGLLQAICECLSVCYLWYW